MEDTLTFIPLLLVLVLAFIVPLLLTRFKRLYLPIVVGEILAGILIGPSILGWVQGDETILVLLAEFGFVFLMFLSGMEINFSNLGTVGNPEQAQKQETFHWGPIQLGIGTFLLTLILSTFVGVAAYNRGIAQSPWIVALIFFHNITRSNLASAQGIRLEFWALWTDIISVCVDCRFRDHAFDHHPGRCSFTWSHIGYPAG